jgi:YbbR domain-containing protein
LKFLALLLGTLLWFTVSGNEIERRVSVPVSYANIPATLEMTGDQIDEVHVHVRGIDNIVSGMSQGDLRVVVDLASAHSGTNIVPLPPESVVAPLGVDVIQLEPGTVTVTLERAGQLTVPVRPTIEGQPAEGYVIGAITVEPPMVIVEGPESRLQGNISVVTERVLLEGRKSTVVQDVGVGVRDAHLRVRQPRTVRVTIRIDPVRSSRDERRRPAVLAGRMQE